MKVHSIIRMGSVKSLRDGCDTYMFQYPLILGRQDSFVSVMPNEHNVEMRVSELWVEGSKEWDVQKLNELFPEEEVNYIKSISLTSRQLSDNQYWKLENKGIFTMKSAYRSMNYMERATIQIIMEKTLESESAPKSEELDLEIGV